MKILCSQWLPVFWSPWTSPNSEFPPWRCFARSSLQPPWVAACLWVFLSLVLSSVAAKHALLDWDQATDLVIEEYSISLPFAVCLESLFIGTVKLRPISFVAFGSMWAENSLKDLRIYPATSVSSFIVNKHQWAFPLAAIHAHAITLPPPCLTLDVVCFGSWDILMDRPKYINQKIQKKNINWFAFQYLNPKQNMT